MGLRSRLNEKSSARVRWEEVTLPATGEVVLVKSLMGGEQMTALRMATRGDSPAVDLYGLVTIAYAAYDPETKERLYNPEVRDDLTEIGALPLEDITTLTSAINRLSGVEDGEAGNAEVPEIVAISTSPTS
jgi:hypothetical protein